MQRLIAVEFTDGSRCEMIPAALDLFLREDNWVRRFRRSSGWVWVGMTPLRREPATAAYQGSERRLWFDRRTVG